MGLLVMEDFAFSQNILLTWAVEKIFIFFACIIKVLFFKMLIITVHENNMTVFLSGTPRDELTADEIEDYDELCKLELCAIVLIKTNDSFHCGRKCDEVCSCMIFYYRKDYTVL